MSWAGSDNNFRRLCWVGSKNFRLGWVGFQKMDPRRTLDSALSSSSCNRNSWMSDRTKECAR